MATYTDWQQRCLDAEEPAREPAMPTMSFEDWLREELEEKISDAIEDLIDDGVPVEDARAMVQQAIEDGEL